MSESTFQEEETEEEDEIDEKEIEEYEENLFKNFKFIDEIKNTPGYLEAKERIELIDDIFSINEENLQKTMDKLRQYLENHQDMVQMFIMVVLLFISTRFKAANQFGSFLLNYFIENYKIEIENLKIISDSLYYNHKPLIGILLNEDLESKDFNFYNYEEGTLPYFLLNDDITGLQDYVSRNACVDFNEYPEKKWIFTEVLDYLHELNIFEYSILFGSVKCFKYIMLNDGVELTSRCNILSVSSGNIEIIRILEQKDGTFTFESFDGSIKFHRNNIFEWLTHNYLAHLAELPDYYELSILFFNEEIFYFIINNGGSIYQLNIHSELFPIQYALMSLNIDFFKYLLKYYQDLDFYKGFKYKNIIDIACSLHQIDLIKYFI